MPTYEYQCESCGNCFDKKLPISQMRQPEQESCIVCGRETIKKRILSGVMFSADVVKPDAKFTERMREIKRTVYKNSLPDY